MRIRRLADCPEFLAGDNSRLREIVHPERDYPFGGRYSLAHATVDPGQSTRRHRLRSDELYYIVSGQGIIHVDSESAEVSPGDAIDIPPGAVQWIENRFDRPLEFLCLVDPAWRAADEEILP